MAVGVLALSMVAQEATAQGFSASVSPPRVEMNIAPGQTSRQVIDIHHAAATSGRYRLYTSDWILQPDGSVAFDTNIVMGSCRPWVAIERRELTVQAQSRYRYRFEVSVPANASPGECRFAIMLEGVDPIAVQQGAISMPVTGRLGIIVYAVIGDAKPVLAVAGRRVVEANDMKLPVLDIRNSGNAHGRLEGILQGVDASGAKIEFVPSNGPILPGETRPVTLTPVGEEGKPMPVLSYPITIKGTLEFGKQRMPLDVQFAP